MSRALSLILYNVCAPFALLAMAPGALVKMRRRGGKWRDFSERLGHYDPAVLGAIRALPRAGGRFWVHAVSVGEVEIAKKIITLLLTRCADCGVVLTTTTPTGRELTREFAQLHAGRVVALYSPVDLRSAVRRALRAFAPTQLVLVEAEVWPNWVSAASRAGIAISLVNARLSKKSEGRYRKLGFMVRPVFELLGQVLVQEPDDVARWSALGVHASRIKHTGSVKFDPDGVIAGASRLATFRAVLNKTGWSDQSPVLLAASTHPGEEEAISKVFRSLKAGIHDLKLIIVPRHVERTSEIVATLRVMGLLPALRTDLETSAIKTDCIIVNTTGELSAWQHLATVVIIGKSFLATGGQNPAEALMACKPVIFGPHMENFSALASLLLHHGGAVRVADFAELESACAHLLRDRAFAKKAADAGRAALTRHAGATQKTVAHLITSNTAAPASAGHVPN